MPKDLSGLARDEARSAITGKEMIEREDLGVRIGVSRLMMMENAGSAISRFISESDETNVVFVAGTGNNGGDAFVAARHLAYWENFKIAVALVGNETDIHAEEALANWKILRNIHSIRLMEINSLEKMSLLMKEINECQIIVCAIFGTGFRGKPRELQSKAIEMINSSDSTKISVDLPSGMEADSGNYEITVLSDYTITMDSPKIGMFANDKSRKACGRIVVANIGVPK
jgi:hydroxyethylthiazole kinase-like uncharacterized protein yjeF